MLEPLNITAFKAHTPPTREEQAVAFVEDAIARGQSGAYADIVRITPEIADALLSRNPKNRPINQRRVDQIAADITNNLWKLNGETIIVSNDGLLNDGQHRLMAISQSGAVVPSFVVFGVDRNARTTTDLGSARTVANLLAMNGAVSTNQAATVAVWLIKFDRREVAHVGSKMPSKAETTAKYWSNREVIDDAIRFVQRKNSRELSADTALAVAYIVIRKVSGDAADIFFEKLCEGAGYEIGSPIHVTRSKLIEMIQLKKTPGQKVAMIISGWNNWRLGKTKVRSMTFKSEYPIIED